MGFVEKVASKKLRAWRKKQDLSQTEAARLLEVSQPTYSEYETGRKVPRTAKAFEIEAKTKGAVKASGWAMDVETEPKDVA